MKLINNILEPFILIWNYRKLIVGGVKQDLKQRYVNSFFGVSWAVIYPFLQLSIYAVLYALVFRIRPSGLTEIGYVLLVFSGLTPLLAFGEIVNAASMSLVGNRALLLNTVFPSDLIPFRAGISGHLRIGNNVDIAGGSGVIKDLPDNSKVMGYPAKSLREFLRENR